MKTNIARLPDWHDRLSSYFAQCAKKHFTWGEHDCALFAASAVHAMTGVDFGEPFRGKYDDAAGAAKALREYGAGTLQRTFTAALGKPKHIARAKRGDIVLYKTSEIDRIGTMGVCAGRFSHFVGCLDDGFQLLPAHDDTAKPFEGLIPVPTSLCARAWTVAF